MKPLELIWEGKHEEKTVQELELMNIELFENPMMEFRKFGDIFFPDNYDKQWVNRLILGDNLYILKALLKDFKEKIKLIYIDPPFATGEDFSYKVQIRASNKGKNSNGENVITEKAYKDTWGKDLVPFLNMLRSRLIIMKELLSNDGSIYLHIDYHSSHYVKILMDEIFGPENFQRDITWNTQALNVAGFKVQAKNWIRASDNLLFYTKSNEFTFNKQFIPRNADFIRKHYTQSDEKGLYRITRRGNKVYLNEDPGDPVTTVWNDILSFNFVAPANFEGEGYPTQKPEALIARIIEASTNQGDLVADFFCGSGTTAVVAEKLGRRWICCDLSRYGIHIAKKRILNVSELKAYAIKDYKHTFRPFVVQTFPDYFLTELKDEGSSPCKIAMKFSEDKNVLINVIDLNIEKNDFITEEMKKRARDFSDYIDYLAIDYNFNGHEFKPQWYSFKTRKKNDITLKTTHEYDKGGNYTILVKVVDIFGNDYIEKREIQIK